MGLITNYRCTFRCEHCLYGASPNVTEAVGEDRLMRLIDQMDHVLGPVLLHIGGGEPLLNFERVRNLLRYLKETRIILEYVETNGSTLIKDRRARLEALKEDGLKCLLVSISPFHNAFMALSELKDVIGDVVDIFGQRGIFPWHAGYLRFLESTENQKPVGLKEYFSRFSTAEVIRQLTSVMYIHPGGRAAELLARHLPRRPAHALFEQDCRGSLSSPVHAHLDYAGNYLTGFCSGLRVGEGAGFDLNRLYTRGISLNQYPILEILIEKGVKGLYERALKTGYAPRKEGYVSSCHMCLHMRTHLYFNDRKYPELYPGFFYEDLGCPDP